MRRSAGAEPPALSIEKWAEVLGFGRELEANSYVNIVYPCTISRVLASTLMGKPDLSASGIVAREDFAMLSLTHSMNLMQVYTVTGSALAMGVI